MTHLILLFSIVGFQVPHKVTKHEVQKRGYLKVKQIYHLNIDTELERRATETELKELAHALTKGEDGYYRIWIFHYLKGQPKEPWAFTHFSPNLEISILGTTENEEETL